MPKSKKNKVFLDKINSPADLKKIPFQDLPLVADEIRRKIIDVTARTGGHVAPSLGAVEIAIALHYLLKMPEDKILWDVGHQAYAHKLLTGRARSFDSLRQLGGISGFPNKYESEYDIFTIGHSSTSISQGLGLACARDLNREDYKIVCVIGDAALANGMALEALNNAGQMKKDITIVLNDNELSISKSVGAISNYLNRVMINPLYNKIREDLQKLLKRVPFFGFKAFRAARKLEEGLKNLLVPGVLFEELGFRYFGPIDGHNLEQLTTTFKSVLEFKEPKLIHVLTKKGKGYRYAEEKPSSFHGIAPFDSITGEPSRVKANSRCQESYSQVFGRKLTELAEKNSRIVAVSAAMCDGTGLAGFARKFPRRFFDVGIAEGHAVTFSAALAEGGLIPVVAIYSTFLQRGYDQIIHDVSLQNLPVVFCLDRAGLVGEDGPTHHGIFDMAYFRHIPNITVMSPRDGLEFEKMIEYALELRKPVAIRYPRGDASSVLPASTFTPIQMGKSEMLREGRDISLIAIGSMVTVALKTADLLSENGIEACVVNARFVKPLDNEMLEDVFSSGSKKVVTIEEGVSEGGFGSAILEFIERANIKNINIKRIGLPDQFIEHGLREELLKKYHLTAEGISEMIKNEFFER